MENTTEIGEALEAKLLLRGRIESLDRDHLGTLIGRG